VPAPITRYRSNICDGTDDVEGAKVVVGDDDGVDDHNDAKGSQIGLALVLLNPLTFVLNKTLEKRIKHPFGYLPKLVTLYIKLL